MITQAISSAYSVKQVLNVSISFKGKTSVSFAKTSGTPALDEVPNVARPLPAFTKSASTCPW